MPKSSTGKQPMSVPVGPGSEHAYAKRYAQALQTARKQVQAQAPTSKPKTMANLRLTPLPD